PMRQAPLRTTPSALPAGTGCCTHYAPSSCPPAPRSTLTFPVRQEGYPRSGVLYRPFRAPRPDREPNHRGRCNRLCPDRDVAFRPDLVSSRQPTESGLIEAAQRGDKDAFATLVAPHAAVAFRAAYLITGSAADAQDAAQEGLVKAWLALGRFRSGAPFRPWLLQIVVNEARNRRRTLGRQERLSLTLAQAPEQTAPAAAGGAPARRGRDSARGRPGRDRCALLRGIVGG